MRRAPVQNPAHAPTILMGCGPAKRVTRVPEAALRRVGTTDLRVFSLCLGGNVFGWTADATQSFAILDAYAAAGGNFIDTADSYASWVPGNSGGESESIVGAWMASRENRDRMIIATKVGEAPGVNDLSSATIRKAAEASLRRLQTDHIDLYYVHRDTLATPLTETLSALDLVVRAGKVRYIAASNFSADRLAAALAVSRSEGYARYVALQPLYNLADRDYELELGPLCAREGLACFPFRSLAKGFFTGKYRSRDQVVTSEHSERALAYLDARGTRLLDALDAVAAAHATSVAAVALAWLALQPTVVAPIASVRLASQLADLLAMRDVRLSPDEAAHLAAAGLDASLAVAQ
jgi:aryl-alcohol dehydrogenase-like predicted oxidoreductase